MRFSVLPTHYNNQHRYVPTPPGISKQKWPTDLLQRKWFFLPSFIARSPFFSFFLGGDDFKYRNVFVHMKNEHKNNWSCLNLAVFAGEECTCVHMHAKLKGTSWKKNIFKPNLISNSNKRKNVRYIPWAKRWLCHECMMGNISGLFVQLIWLYSTMQVQLLLMTIGIFFFMSLI